MHSIHNRLNVSIRDTTILALAVIFSVISQISAIESITRPLMYIIWLCTLLIGLSSNNGNLRISSFTTKMIIAYCLFCAIQILCSVFNYSHISNNYMRVLMVPIIISVVGDIYSIKEKRFFNSICRAYVFSSAIYAVWVQITYFPSFATWLSNNIYIFQEKNSAAQIWSSAIFIALILIEYKNKYERFFYYALSLYLLYMIGMSQCRTAILGIAVVVVFFVLLYSKKKVLWITIIAILVIAMLNIQVTKSYLEQALFLTRYSDKDLNQFSSLRLDLYSKAIEKFIEDPIFGVGEYYVDCSYLMLLAESGVVGFLLIEYIWLKKIIQCFRFRYKSKEQTFLFASTTYYFVVSLLEGYPPFGPGVSTCMFWLLSSAMNNITYQKQLFGQTQS